MAFAEQRNATMVNRKIMNQKRNSSTYKQILNNLRRYALVMTLILLFIYQLFRFMKLSILDFDGHHDGYIVASAISVSEGRVLYRDVFWQYGPLQPYLLAALVKILPFLSPLLVVRLTGLVSIWVVFLVVLFQPTVRRQEKPESLSIKLTVASLFLLVQDQFYGVPFLFWPNHLSILFLVLSFDLLLKQIRRPNEPSKSQYLQGIYLALIVLARPQFFLVVLLLFLLMIAHIKIRNEIHRFPFLLLGFAGPLFIGAAVLTKQNAVDDFVQQTWNFPRTEYSNQLVIDFFQILKGVATSNLIYVGAVTIFLANYSFKFLNRLSYFKLVSVIVTTIIYKVYYGNSNIWVSGLVYPARSSVVILEIAYLTAVLTCLYFLFFNVYRLAFKPIGDRNVAISHLIVCCVALVSISQSFPVFDTRHTNWAVLGLIPLMVTLLLNLPRKYQRVWIFFGVSLTLVLFVETQRTSKAYEDLARVTGSSKFVGGDVETVVPHDSMLIWVRRSSSLESEFQFLDTVFNGDEKAIFVSGDAAFSIFDGSLRSVDKWFVNWGPVPWLSTRIKESDYPLIIWDELSASISERNQIYLSGYELVEQRGRLWVYRFHDYGI